VDQVTGDVSHRVLIDGGVFGPIGKIRFDAIGMEVRHLSERIYRIHPDDPNSAKAIMTQTYEMGRGAWQVRIDAGAEMTSTVSSFELSSWIEAYEGDRSIFRREWKRSLPRRCV
jgi:hypothetical protein